MERASVVKGSPLFAHRSLHPHENFQIFADRVVFVAARRNQGIAAEYAKGTRDQQQKRQPSKCNPGREESSEVFNRLKSR